jgi:hypothetical protein
MHERENSPNLFRKHARGDNTEETHDSQQHERENTQLSLGTNALFAELKRIFVHEKKNSWS